MQKKEQLNDSVVKEKEPDFMSATGALEYGLTNDYLFHVVMQKNEKVLRGLI